MEELPDSCTTNWTSAMADHDKTLLPVFEETGVFVISCWHHIVLKVVDMIQSGELYVLSGSPLVSV
ncbi:hypothetical protein BS47DRAFT_1304859 [Hydnum rufescens UP504]|uniref:Uncharacterized protein n=1 Tax=Hydnum rufescens UP504 TaxID=1448309 RepID=A0A9P6AJ41_9AGAM|nr:hypothetical protein BS47DRAFT_1304859 [Hydnum rufescens UP504]